eukprot:1374230-Amorphochlora_amoeboformis.AAC.1
MKAKGRFKPEPDGKKGDGDLLSSAITSDRDLGERKGLLDGGSEVESEEKRKKSSVCGRRKIQ